MSAPTLLCTRCGAPLCDIADCLAVYRGTPHHKTDGTPANRRCLREPTGPHTSPHTDPRD